MLTDPREIEIIAQARQKNVRDPSRSREHFERIFETFFASKDLTGQVLLDLGPGQYDFAVLANQRGAEAQAIDNDPAVLELGRYRGYTVIDDRIQDIRPELFAQPFDGLFCKFSINAFWYWESEQEQVEFLDRLLSIAKPDAWLWIAPWNGVPKAGVDRRTQARTLEVQAEFFRRAGCSAIDLGASWARHFGVNGSVANNVVFVRGLEVGASLSGRRIF